MATLTVWRVVEARWAADPFSGEGARLHGGRWASPGRPVVYAAESLALATLEALVRAGHFDRLRGYRCVPATADVADDLIETLALADLPAGWDARPPTAVSQALGDAWLGTGWALALRVPSVVVPPDRNVLLNPAHPAFGALRVGAALPVPVDPRLVL